MTMQKRNPSWKTSEDYPKVRVKRADGGVSTVSFDPAWYVTHMRAAGGKRAFSELAKECARGYAGRSQGTRSAYVRRLVAERLAAPQK